MSGFLNGFFCGDECQNRKNIKAESEKIKAQAMLQATEQDGKQDFTIIIASVIVCVVIVITVVVLKKMKMI